MPKRSHALIYLPGLGDKSPIPGGLQKIAVQLWRLHGFTPHYFRIGWNDTDETYQMKVDRLQRTTEALRTRHGVVSLVGSSAGGSLLINAFAADTSSIHRVVAIAGKIRGAERVGNKIYEINPAIEEAVKIAENNLLQLSARDRSRILTLSGTDDTLVGLSDSQVEGAKNIIVGPYGHLITIAYALTFGFFKIARFVRQPV